MDGLRRRSVPESELSQQVQGPVQRRPRSVTAAYDLYKPELGRRYARPDLIEQRFSKDVIPVIGARPLGQVTEDDLRALLQQIIDRGSRVQANRTVPDLQHFFAYCADREWISTNPAARIKRTIAGEERSRTRSLSTEELWRFTRELIRREIRGDTRLALSLLLLTGQQPQIVLGVHEGQVAGSWWHTDTHKVYLSPQSRAVLRQAFRELGPKPFISDHRALSRVTNRFGFNPPITPQDLRRTMRTWLCDREVHPYIVEQMMGNRPGNVWGIAREQQTRAQKAAWRRWGVFLALIRRGVVRQLHNEDRRGRKVRATKESWR